MKLIPITLLKTGKQIREKTYENIVEQYSADMLNGWGDFPAIDVIQRDETIELYEIADGIHRFEAAKRAGIKEVPIIVIGHDDWALRCGAIRKNSRHGLGLTPRERKKIRREFLMEFPSKTLKEWASVLGVSTTTVSNTKKELEDEGFEFPDTVEGSDGKTYRTKYERRTPKHDSKTPSNMVSCFKCGDQTFRELADAPDSSWIQEFDHGTGKYYWVCDKCRDSYYAELQNNIENDVISRVEENEAFVHNTPVVIPIPPQKNSKEQVKLKSYIIQIPENLSIEEIYSQLPYGWKYKEEFSEKKESKFEAPDLSKMDKKEAEKEANFGELEAEEEPADLFDKREQEPVIETEIAKETEDEPEKKPENKSKKKSEPEEGSGFVWILNDGSSWELSKSMFEFFKKNYPAVDVEQELRNCIGWNVADPKHRKTKAGITKHINAWLISCQNRARTKTYSGGNYSQPYKRRIDESAFTSMEGY